MCEKHAGYSNSITEEVAYWLTSGPPDAVPTLVDRVNAVLSRDGVAGVASVAQERVLEGWVIPSKPRDIVGHLLSFACDKVNWEEVALVLIGYARVNAQAHPGLWGSKAGRIYLAQVIDEEVSRIFSEALANPNVTWTPKLRKIPRIRVLRKWYYLGLKESKDAIELMFEDNGYGPIIGDFPWTPNS